MGARRPSGGNEEKTNTQVLVSPVSPIINAQEVGEVQTATPLVALNI